MRSEGWADIDPTLEAAVAVVVVVVVVTVTGEAVVQCRTDAADQGACLQNKVSVSM